MITHTVVLSLLLLHYCWTQMYNSCLWAFRFGDYFETLNCKLLFFSGCLFEYYFSTCKFCFFILSLVWGCISVAFDQLFHWECLRIMENNFRKLLDIVCHLLVR